ncbi:hypothetical protein FB451DRAFT_1432654, partial [Mycena latifolia]
LTLSCARCGPPPENATPDAKAAPELKDAPDFLRKLYNILEDPALDDIISWGPQGDSLHVKDVDGFTKSLLPRNFKHSNFASFVRQLNKYGFRKVRSVDGYQGDEQSWVFRHPDFHAGRPGALKNMKRKVSRNSILRAAAPPLAPYAATYTPVDSETIRSLPAQLSFLHGQLKSRSAAEEDVLSYVRNLEGSYKEVLGEMVGFRRCLAQLDGFVHALLPSFPPENSPDSKWVAPSAEREASHIQDRPAHPGTQRFHDSARAQEQAVLSPQTARLASVDVNGEEEDEMVMPTPTNPSNWDVARAGEDVRSREPPPLRVRGWSLLPGWAVPPRVLLVDDDAVIRKLSSRFLQIFGCTIDVAVDGVGAVTQMNLAKYDLVLMDIVMPKLDGVSATALIRKFDALTPIISMTSSSRPTEIMSYYSSGMNDILPKPFTKEGLFDMLEKHLAPLLMITQQMPTSMCVRPAPVLDDAGFSPQSDMGMSASSADDGDGSIDGLGISDAGYNALFASIFTDGTVGPAPDSEKRAFDLDSDSDDSDGRVRKRGRFDVDE